MNKNDARDFLQTLEKRGFIHQMTDREGLADLLSQTVVTGYIGFDATADSLHVGHLMQIMVLRHLQQAGHRPIVLMGGGTTRIGDPSFKTEARPMLDDAAIAANIAGMQRGFGNYLRFGAGPTDAIMVNNADWLDKLGYVEMLRKVGSHFTVNRMLTFDSVQLRLDREQPLTFLEFNYMILQAYDFVELNKRYGCRLQMSGSDQWGNIVNGVELSRRLGGPELFGLTTPLLTTASGAKMGKSVAGAVWLNADRLPPYDFWQYWRNTEDADVGRFLKLYTELPLAEIARLETLQGTEINEAKKILAHEVTRLAHGEVAALAAAETARQTFEHGGMGGDLPVHEIAGSAAVTDILVALGFAASKGEAKRKIEEGAVRLEGESVTSPAAMIAATDLGAEGLRLSLGKKKHGVVKKRA